MKRLVKNIRKGDVLIWDGEPRKITDRIFIHKRPEEPHYLFSLEGLDGVLAVSEWGYLEVPDLV